MAYLAEFAVAAAVAAAALVPSTALMRSAALAGAETKCYTVAHGLTKALYEHRNLRIVGERALGMMGDEGFSGFGGGPSVPWSSQNIQPLHQQLADDCGQCLGDLAVADLSSGLVVNYAPNATDKRAVLLPSHLVLIEFVYIDNDSCSVRYSSIRPRPGFHLTPTLAQTDGVYNDFLIVKTVLQRWKRTADGRPTFTRPYTVTPAGNFSFDL